jgi:hypothetical protein
MAHPSKQKARKGFYLTYVVSILLIRSIVRPQDRQVKVQEPGLVAGRDARQVTGRSQNKVPHLVDQLLRKARLPCKLREELRAVGLVAALPGAPGVVDDVMEEDGQVDGGQVRDEVGISAGTRGMLLYARAVCPSL